MKSPTNKHVLAVVNDLFFVAKITDSAKRAGVTVEYLTSEKEILEKVHARPMLIIFDLNLDAANPLRLIGKLKGSADFKSISLLAYLSHVQGELKQKALELGCDMVMPKSAFSVNLPSILKRHAGTL